MGIRIFRGEGHAHYLDCHDGFMGVYKCQNLSVVHFE